MCSCHWPGSAIRGRRCRGCVRVKKFSGSGFGAGVLFAVVRAGSTEFFERPRLPILFVFSADSVAIPPPRLDVGASARTVRSGCSSPIAAARAAVADRRVLRIGGGRRSRVRVPQLDPRPPDRQGTPKPSAPRRRDRTCRGEEHGTRRAVNAVAGRSAQSPHRHPAKDCNPLGSRSGRQRLPLRRGTAAAILI